MGNYDEKNDLKVRWTAIPHRTIPELPLFTDDIKFKKNLEDPLARERR